MTHIKSQLLDEAGHAVSFETAQDNQRVFLVRDAFPVQAPLVTDVVDNQIADRHTNEGVGVGIGISGLALAVVFGVVASVSQEVASSSVSKVSAMIAAAALVAALIGLGIATFPTPAPRR